MRAKARLVSPVERLLYLRTLSLFGELSGEELAVIAPHMRERHFRRGQALLREGGKVDAIHVLVDGEVRVSRGDVAFRTLRAGDSVGMFALLAGAPEGVEAVALSETLSLELPGAALYDLLEEHFSIFHHVLRANARQLLAERAELGEQVPPGGEACDIVCPARQLDLVERILVLRRSMPFAETSLVGLAQLARRARERRFGEGAALWRAGDPSDRMLLPIAGGVECRGGQGSRRRVRGVPLGLVETVAEAPHRFTAAGEDGLVALEVDREALLDVFEDHFEMAAGALRSLAADILEAVERRAARSEAVPVGLASGVQGWSSLP